MKKKIKRKFKFLTFTLIFFVNILCQLFQTNCVVKFFENLLEFHHGICGLLNFKLKNNFLKFLNIFFAKTNAVSPSKILALEV